ncbi:unnamed protein product [Protopolystoma xenopodis]|uniref:Uncharacterized protein n=1 Tax=Protopolystoma xenopodis TaxID=117903 RepID=A0A448WPZ7_9PLAT|nr:unnamed protein product [Protopolystoma xenopodis]
MESGDYTLESGAKRNFEALKTAEEQEAKAAAEEEEELKNNPMKLLEKRTEQSKREMDMVEILEDLREINKRHAGLDADRVLLRKLWEEKDKQETEEIQQEEKFINALAYLGGSISTPGGIWNTTIMLMLMPSNAIPTAPLLIHTRNGLASL